METRREHGACACGKEAGRKLRVERSVRWLCAGTAVVCTHRRGRETLHLPRLLLDAQAPVEHRALRLSSSPSRESGSTGSKSKRARRRRDNGRKEAGFVALTAKSKNERRPLHSLCTSQHAQGPQKTVHNQATESSRNSKHRCTSRTPSPSPFQQRSSCRPIRPRRLHTEREVSNSSGSRIGEERTLSRTETGSLLELCGLNRVDTTVSCGSESSTSGPSLRERASQYRG